MKQEADTSPSSTSPTEPWVILGERVAIPLSVISAHLDKIKLIDPGYTRSPTGWRLAKDPVAFVLLTADQMSLIEVKSAMKLPEGEA